MVFTRYFNFEVQGCESLKPYHIGVMRGIKSTEMLTKGMERTFLHKFDQMFFMLEKERIDIGLTDRVLGLEIIHSLNFKNIRYLEPPLIKRNLYHYVHKKHNDIVGKLTKALREMEKSGRIEQIRNEFIEKLQ